MKFPPTLATLIVLCAIFPVVAAELYSSEEIDENYQIVARAQDTAVLEKRVRHTDPTGSQWVETNRFTVLENCLHYRDQDEWRLSEDLIEVFPDGAAALRGPNKAIFSHDINAEAVFDIETSAGERIRGGVRAIQLSDFATGQSMVIATIKESAQGVLLPPNQILYEDAFDGIAADVLLDWKHNIFSHDVVLKERPVLPKGWDAANVRLEVVTEFFVDAEPELRTQRAEGDDALEDDLVIDFGAMEIVMGKAFAIPEEGAVNLGGFADDGVPVLKQWWSGDDGRRFLVESVAWRDVESQFQDVAAAESPKDSPVLPRAVAMARVARAKPRVVEAIETAQWTYSPRGYVIDFVTIPDQGTPNTLLSGETYYVKTSYYNGNAVTFQPGCVVKFKENAYALLYGSVAFPATNQAMAVFTSRNDDEYGSIIQNAPGESGTGSNGDPTLHRAAKALWIYFVSFSTEIRAAQIRWAKTGVRYDRNAGQTQTHYLRHCIFEHIRGSGTMGVDGTSYLSVSNLRSCDVSNPVVAMTRDCIAFENARPGTSSWQLTAPASPTWPTVATQQTPEVAGFASATSVNVGGTIKFYVDVRRNTDTGFKLQIYRMGWYNSQGARLMRWSDSSLGWVTEVTKSQGKQPIHLPDAANGGVVDCLSGNPWLESYQLSVPHTWISGIYLAKLTTAGPNSQKQAFVIFAVRDDTRSSDFYFQSSVTTFQAYNPWGGQSLYPYPTSPHATKVSFNRPYAGSSNANLAYGTGAGEFLVAINAAFTPAWEYNALRWIEKHGFDATYCTSVDTHAGWPSGKTTKAFLSVGHDEYWSAQMRSNVEAKRNSGVNLAFLGSNVCYWRATFDSGLRAFSVNKVSNADLWRGPVINNPENSLVGIGYVYNSLDEDMVVKNPSPSGNWGVFDYTGLAPGSSATLTGLLGYEVDGCWVTQPAPACSAYPFACLSAGTNILAQTDFVPLSGCGAGIATVRAYMTLNRAPVGSARVLATGSMQWVWGLDDFGYPLLVFPQGSRVHPTARQITFNVLRKFAGLPTQPVP